MLPDFHAYATYLYTLATKFPGIQSPQVNCFTLKSNTGIANGVLHFSQDLRLHFVEHLDFNARRITWYSYEIWQGNEKLCYYDPQEHPNDPTLASTHPHHKHLPPDIKHHRVPEPGLSFDQPNLDFLIGEIEKMLGTLT